MKINTATASDEELLRFFIWDGQTVDEAIEFVTRHLRPDMLPPTDEMIQRLKEYESSFNN